MGRISGRRVRPVPIPAGSPVVWFAVEPATPVGVGDIEAVCLVSLLTTQLRGKKRRKTHPMDWQSQLRYRLAGAGLPALSSLAGAEDTAEAYVQPATASGRRQ
jgi:hypothetical protein